MIIKTLIWDNNKWISNKQDEKIDADLVLLVGNRYLLEDETVFNKLRALTNGAIVSNSTSGHIVGDEVFDEGAVATVIKFAQTKIKPVVFNCADFENELTLGTRIYNSLADENLNYIYLVSDGQFINGSNLVSGLKTNLNKNVLITGGLAGDGDRFEKTLVGLDEVPKPGNVVAVGFYGERLKVGYGSNGGWSSFGPDRVITKSNQNVLYELDGQSALSLYKEYLGDFAKDLPASALHFPLNVKLESGETVVRTILSINEEEESMTFAGNMPEGRQARLMKSHLHKLINGGEVAVESSLKNFGTEKPTLAIIVSCVGRKIIMKHNVEEEIEVVRHQLGDNCVISGYYAYGEITPKSVINNCELHNQTITITTFSEI